MSELILALDFGGTKHAAAVAARGESVWRAQRRVPAPAPADGAADRAVMFALARELLAGQKPAAIGVSFGGPVDFPAGTVILSHHVPGWAKFPLAAVLESEFGAPARVDNDANVAALGEHRLGAGRGADSLLYITVSTGVGGGWILHGQPWRGQDGMAGEIGHTVVDPAGPLCLCGKRGCVERLASGRNLARRARERLEREPGSGAALRELVSNDLTQVDGRLVSQAATQGDEFSQSVLAEAGHALGVGIGNAANFINPNRFVLGGGVIKAGELWWNAVRAAARATALPEARLDIVPAGLGDDAPLWGAVALTEGL